MITRKIEKEITRFCNTKEKKALLITGARQVGKTFIIENTCGKNSNSFAKLNFIENPKTIPLFENAK